MKAQQLRNGVLQLAIQGKLVPQDPTDEPASVLLEKIKVEKEHLIKDKKIKREKPVAEITEEEKPFDIPDSWVWVRLYELCNINGGYAFKSADFTKNGMRVIRISDFDENGFKNNKIVRHNYTDDLFNYKIERYNILMAMTGGTVGKSFFVTELAEEMITNQRVANIKIVGGINKYYINSVILSPITKQVVNKRKNSTNDNISMDDIKGFIIPLPPLAEQRRIVAKIEEIMPLIDQYEKFETELSILEADFPKYLKKSILQYAVQGKLVEQNNDDEPASVLLEKIEAEKEQLIRDKKIKREKPLPEITDEEKPFDIPDSWEWLRLGEVVQINPRNKIDDELDVSFIPMSLIADGYSNVHTSDICKWNEIKSGFTHFQENDVAIAKITPCFENRKSVVLSNLFNGYGAGTTELHILRTYGNTIIDSGVKSKSTS